jgi:hypothetical protein
MYRPFHTFMVSKGAPAFFPHRYQYSIIYKVFLETLLGTYRAALGAIGTVMPEASWFRR